MRRIRSARGRALAGLAALAAAFAGLTAVAPAASAATNAYVNMGDSLSSGEGTYGTYLSGTDTSANVCHRSPNSYSALYVASSHDSYSLKNVACSGAGVNEISSTADPNTGGNHDANEAPQDSALSDSTRLVTLSIGINDLGLIQLATKCYSKVGKSEEDKCFTGLLADPTYTANLRSLPYNLDRAYSDIRDHATNATVAVLTYPQIFPSTFTGACHMFPDPTFGPQWLVTSQGMLDVAHKLVDQLDATIKTEVAKYQGFILVDEENALAGHDVCASTSWVNPVNGVTFTNQIPDDESLHPTVAGYQAMSDVLEARLDAGYFADGSTDQNIVNAYNASGGLGGFGYPADNGGGPYVHYSDVARANVEDFTGGGFGPVIMVDGPRGTFLVNYGFRDAYIGGYASTCLAPVDNAYSSGGGTRQDFVNCYMTWTPSSGVVVHGSDPTTCTDYGGRTMTGPNACVGFHTAPAPGQPASANVWYSGGGVGLFGQEIWTYGNGTTATSTAVYNLSGLDTIHVMQLQAYIPDNNANASNAHYRYCAPGSACVDGYVNQNNYANQWATFGAVCTTDGTAMITLADDGGDTYPAVVGADAIRAVRTGIVC